MTQGSNSIAPYNSASNAPNATKERLMHAALVVFSARGYQRMTIEVIARQAQVSRPTFYMHFESKSDIVTQSLIMQWGKLNDALKAASASTLSLEVKSSARLSTYFSWWCEHAELGKRVFSEVNDPSSPVFAVRRSMISSLVYYWTEQLRIKNPSATIDDLEVSALLSMIEQLCMQFFALNKDDRETEKERYISCAATIMHSYLAYKK